MSRFRITGLRIALSLGLGLALWLFVSYTENPDRITALGTIPVASDNLSPGLVTINGPSGEAVSELPPVDLTVEGDQETTSKLLPSDFRAFVDLRGLGPGEHKVPVNVVPNRPDINRVNTFTLPNDLSIRIDQEITKTVPLTIEVTGQVPFSFERLDPRVTVDGQPISEVQISGPQNRVERVTKVRATTNVDQLTANYESARPLEPLDANGEIVAGVTVTPSTAQVLIPIRPSLGLKRVPIVPQTAGEPAAGFMVTNIAVDPQFVNVTGGSGALDEVNQIATANVDIANASETLSQTVELQVPPQVGIQPGEPTTATVTVTIEPITRLFSINIPVPVRTINAPSNTDVEIDPITLNLALSGTASQLANFDATAVKAIVNLNRLKPGTYTLTPNVTVPDNVTLDRPPDDVTVTITMPSTPTPQPSPQPSPTPAASPTAEAAPTEAPQSATNTATPADSGAPTTTTESVTSDASMRNAESITSTTDVTTSPMEESATALPTKESTTPTPSPTDNS